ncbi:transglutaminase domain-containing protein, partial [Nocardia salmonicida]|uniref:transglutaminase family protein n=1 Tax=Nocardia salmonicida TaxID=53431 RepID=UPI0033FFBAF4
MPRPTGLSASVPRTTVPWSLAATDDLESLWLPAPLYLESIEAGEEWRYDADTLDIHSASNDVNTQGIDYSLTAIEPELAPAPLSRAGRAQFELATRYTRLPNNLPGIVEDLAAEVTKGRPSDFHRAVALQNWFQREFTYSTDTAPGNGNDELEEFLSEDGRTGYCEQFASAMAVMARSLDIPARVAVGFLEAATVARFGGVDVWINNAGIS